MTLIPSSHGCAVPKPDKQLFREAQNSWPQAQFLWGPKDSERLEIDSWVDHASSRLDGKICSLTYPLPPPH